METNKLHIITQPVVQQTTINKQTSAGNLTESFQDILSRERVGANQVKLSAHAQRRLEDRNIVLDQQDWGKINNAINKAEAKGANNSLLIHGDLALIVSIKNRTVISAMDDASIKEHVFTNIDSTVIIK